MKNTVIILLWLIFVPIHAHKYYVAKDGSDLNAGTCNKPFKTIQKAADNMRAGDICFIKKGVYREIISLNYDGNASQPIRFENYKNDTVVIMATKTLSKWENYKGDIYKTYCPNYVSQVFHNYKQSYLASYPNITEKFNSDEWLSAQVDSTGSVSLTGIKFTKDSFEVFFITYEPLTKP